VIARLLVLLAVCSLALAVPAAAVAQDNPFGPIPQAPPEQPPPAPESGDPNQDGLSDWQQLLIGVAAVALLGGIAWAIVRDARAAAPADDRRTSLDDPADRPKGSRTPPKRRVKQNRAKAKVARQARKRNR
jgi:hypothetical protein